MPRYLLPHLPLKVVITPEVVQGLGWIVGQGGGEVTEELMKVFDPRDKSLWTAFDWFSHCRWR
jgi:hypothetical protein